MTTPTVVKRRSGRSLDAAAARKQAASADRKAMDAEAQPTLSTWLVVFAFVYILVSGTILGSFYWQLKPVTSAVQAVFAICRGA